METNPILKLYPYLWGICLFGAATDSLVVWGLREPVFPMLMHEILFSINLAVGVVLMGVRIKELQFYQPGG